MDPNDLPSYEPTHGASAGTGTPAGRLSLCDWATKLAFRFSESSTATAGQREIATPVVVVMSIEAEWIFIQFAALAESQRGHAIESNPCESLRSQPAQSGTKPSLEHGTPDSSCSCLMLVFSKQA